MLAVLLVVVPIRVALQPARWQELFPALAWTIWPIGSFLIMRWRWSKQFTKSPSSNIDMLATIDERGVTLSALGENKAYYWAGFSQIYESSAVVVFEKGYGDFIYIPKRAIASAQFEELARLTSLAINCKVRLASPLT